MADTATETQPIILNNRSDKGDTIQATFLPDRGMNLCSFKKNGVELIDQSTRQPFEERAAGLGPLIGPHFYRRNPATLPNIDTDLFFPRLAKTNESDRQAKDPFTHGIARYAPWKATFDETSFEAELFGKDLWNGISLAELEGQNFKMHFKGNLTETTLNISLDVVSDTDSIVGIHYYYHLPNNTGKVISRIKPFYLKTVVPDRQHPSNNVKLPIPSDWGLEKDGMITYQLNQDTDFTFHPFPDPLSGNIILETELYRLTTSYSTDSQENSWQLYHPKGASFVCVEPTSSQDPRHPNLTASAIHISLTPEILPN